MNPLGHEFDSSQTCNYCGIAEENVPKGFYPGEAHTCPVRRELAKKEEQAKKDTGNDAQG